ncbi:YqkE family protein [Paenibacillus hunanensis]|uniref:YqkE family protein n=1 Tax=Paenibacillus hunanensis TaxID=539262 RepID=UPI002A6B31C9|nr:YqkE family protein [Paenibacillus hunanensis]WPP40820.1 YqkE family protein [Paenibacillus hunanensis]
MAKKNKASARPAAPSQDKPATLKDMLSADVLDKLKAQATELREQEHERQEQQRLKVEEERRAEQKRRDNDFGYLLENSKQDWKKYK